MLVPRSRVLLGHSTASARFGLGLISLSVSLACASVEEVTPQRGGGSGGDSGVGTTGGSAAAGQASAHGGVTGNGGTSTGSGGTAQGGANGSGGAAKGGVTGSGGAAKGGATGNGGANVGGSVSSGPSGTQLFLDDFEDGDYTAPTTMQWLSPDTNGTYSVASVVGSKALNVVGSSKTMAVSGESSWTDQHVEAKVVIVAGTSTIASLYGRWAALKNYIVIEYRVGTTSSPKGDLKLRENDGGSTADICRFKPDSALPGEAHTIGFSVTGGAGSPLILYFDGQAVTTDVPCVLGTDGPLNGGVAVGVQSGTAAFDDVTVTVP